MSYTSIILLVIFFVLVSIMIRQSHELKFKYERRKVLKIIVFLTIGLIGHKVFAEKQKGNREKSGNSEKSKEKTKTSTDGKQSNSGSEQPSINSSDNDKTSQEKKK